MTQLAPTASVAAQVLVSEKVELALILDIFRVAEPVLAKVTF
jgi:hypothetical protein